MSNDWTNKLRDHLADYQEPVKDDLWAAIEQSLAQSQNVVQPHTATKYRVMVRRFSMAAAIAALAIGGTYVYLHPWHQEIQPRMAASITPRKTVGETAKAQSRPNLFALAVPEKNILHGRKPVMAQVVSELLTSPSQDSALVAMASETQEVSVPEPPTCTSEDVELQPKPKTKSMERMLMGQPMEVEAVGKKRHARSWSVNVYGENAFAGNGSHAGRQPLVASDMPGSASFFSGAPDDAEGFGPMVSAKGLETLSALSKTEKPKHHQPFSVGMQVGVGLTERLRLTTGVVYTRAVSDLDAVTTQKLHYVGIPLSLSYQVWGTRRFHTYLTMGGEGAVNVKNQTEVDGEAVESKKDRVQWSANAAVGAQYDLVPQLGVYVEPGAKYYFDNGSQVKNVFKDKKLNFNFLFGLRWNIGKE